METENITIRKADRADAPAVAALTDAAYSKYIPLIGRKPQPMTAAYDIMAVENTIWLLSVEGRLAGVLVLVDEPQTLLIYSIAIHPDFKNRGSGAA